MKNTKLILAILVFTTAWYSQAQVAVFPNKQQLEPIADQHEASPLSVSFLKSKDNYAKLVYSRPSLRNRKMIGGEAIPYGKVWRFGANQATEISFNKSISIGGKKLTAGTYTLFAIPNKNKWTIVINSDLGQWGSFTYNKGKDIHRFDVDVKKAPKKFEKFSLWFAQNGNAINAAWDTVHVEIPIQL